MSTISPQGSEENCSELDNLVYFPGVDCGHSIKAISDDEVINQLLNEFDHISESDALINQTGLGFEEFFEEQKNIDSDLDLFNQFDHNEWLGPQFESNLGEEQNFAGPSDAEMMNSLFYQMTLMRESTSRLRHFLNEIEARLKNH
jgi:hypothetical protein